MINFNEQASYDLTIGLITGQLDSNNIRRLLNAGANPDVGIDPDVTALRYVIKRGYDTDTIKTLLEGGASINTTDRNGVGMIASYLESPVFMQEMSDEVSYNNPPAILDYLLKNGAPLEVADEQGTTPFMIYCDRYTNPEIAQLLIDNGADVNAANLIGSTPLLRALTFGVGSRSRDSAKTINAVVEKLLQAGASIEAASNRGITPLGMAIEVGNYYSAQLLIERGANTEPTPALFYLEPIFAVVSRNQARLEAASKAGMNLDVRNPTLQTALMWAAELGDTDAVRFLLDNGADIHARDLCGWTALFFAVNNAHEDVCKILLAAGANPNHFVSDAPYGIRNFNALKWLVERDYYGPPLPAARDVYALLLSYGTNDEGVDIEDLFTDE